MQIEIEILADNTSVVQELSNQIAYYENLLISADNDNTINIQRIISTTEILIEEYQSYASRIQNRGSFSIHSPSVAIVIAYFNSKGFKLAAELLTHAKDNDVLDSIYYPINGYLVEESTTFASIKEGNILKGDGVFNLAEHSDLYYAIHGFRYSKSQSNRTIEIQDRYDFEYDITYGSVAGIAVSIMAAAQSVGTLVPYYSVITRNFDRALQIPAQQSIIMLSNSRYIENVPTLGKEEYLDINFVSFIARRITIQTFGSKDAYVKIYRGDEMVFSNDDSGHESNAFIGLDCIAGAIYKIRLSFYSSNQSGEIKLTFMPTYQYTNWNDYRLENKASFILNSTNDVEKVWQIIFKPTKQKSYMLKLISEIDMYLFCIDPRSTYEIRIKKVDQIAPSAYDHKRPGYESPLIIKDLAKNIPYLIVFSKANPSSNHTNNYTIDIR